MFQSMYVRAIKVAATSLKLEIRLHAYQIGTNTQSGTNEFLLHVVLCQASRIMQRL